MRNQLLRDADWAGMAHGIEIRVPLVDVTLLKSLAPVITNLAPAAGKAALARAPFMPLPEAVVSRAKTGFSVPTGAWMSVAFPHGKPFEGTHQPSEPVSRCWSRVVLNGLGNTMPEVRAL
jgi:asparagine synthase (glutamine-hydrolysing)